MLNLMIIHLVGLLSPGPDFFYVSRISAMSSRREAIGGVIGITIGVLIWATAAVLGLAIIFATMPIVQGIVMMLGGSYLVYLGIKMWGSDNICIERNKKIWREKMRWSPCLWGFVVFKG